MANLRAWNSSASSSSSAKQQQLQFKALLGEHLVVPPGMSADAGVVLPVGAQIIPDFGAFLEGEIAYRPKFDDSRMVPRGTALPPYSGEQGYMGGIKIPVMVLRHGLCSLVSTSESVVRQFDAMYDAFIFAPEAQRGQLPVYRIEEARSFTTKYRPDPVYAPVYAHLSWVDRDPDAFGRRLIPPPKSTQALDAPTTPALALETDKVFATSGEVLPPERSPHAEPWAKPPTAGDLDDEIPF